jgi:hypothetical protein
MILVNINDNKLEFKSFPIYLLWLWIWGCLGVLFYFPNITKYNYENFIIPFFIFTILLFIVKIRIWIIDNISWVYMIKEKSIINRINYKWNIKNIKTVNIDYWYWWNYAKWGVLYLLLWDDNRINLSWSDLLPNKDNEKFLTTIKKFLNI